MELVNPRRFRQFWVRLVRESDLGSFADSNPGSSADPEPSRSWIRTEAGCADRVFALARTARSSVTTSGQLRRRTTAVASLSSCLANRIPIQWRGSTPNGKYAY